MKADDLGPATEAGLLSWQVGVGPLIGRPLQPQDLLAIRKLFRGFLLASLLEMEQGNCHLVVADMVGALAGFYALEAANGELTDLWLAPQWHGAGLAQIMMTDAKHKCLALGHKQIRLEVIATNARAIAFYHKQHFTRTEPTAPYDHILGVKLEKLTMVCDLDSVTGL